MRQFQVRKDDIAQARIIDLPDAALGDGDIRVKIDRFALTANNVTYAAVGDRIGYWRFFPAEEGWGVIPVWGVAEVVETRHPDIPQGDRLYGYFPMGDELVISPGKVSAGRLVDGAEHRAQLPPVYNAYARLAADPDYDRATDEERMLLYPLYATSYCLYDFLLDHDWYGAAQVIIVSASSKTAIGLAYALADDANAPRVVGATSSRNKENVEALKLYDQVVTYDALDDIDAASPAAIIDMSGAGPVLGELHKRLGDNMRYTSNVGLTHWEDNKMGSDFIRERSEMFFAPGHIQKRTKDWGPGVFEQKSLAFWRSAAERSRAWLSMQTINGFDAIGQSYDDVREGRSAPTQGLIVAL
ncbi:MAG: DUF2855 family protein [Pseudomonadota bacterium]